MPKRTALYDEHLKLGGRMTDFGGWDLPIQYSGVIEEHLACREAAGLFDVSHMGEVTVEGSDAEEFLNYLVSNDLGKLAVGQAQYSAMCNENGGIVDDLVIYRRGRDRFLVVVNASNTAKDFAHMGQISRRFVGKTGDLKLTDESPLYTQIAIQGRNAQQILQTISDIPLAPIKTYWFAEGHALKNIPTIFARTGYTGEDGFELYVPWASGPEIWRSLMKAGAPLGLKPCGLGARDTLRLEMKYPLYGNELTDETNPLEAGLGWVTRIEKRDFVGKAAILKAKESGIQRKLVGFRLTGRGIARHGYPVFSASGDARLGEVTSGTQSPCLKQSIGVAYIPLSSSAPGSPLSVDIRGQKIPAEVVPTPFYKRPY